MENLGLRPLVYHRDLTASRELAQQLLIGLAYSVNPFFL